MPAKKGNQTAKGNKGGGRKTTYKPEYAKLAYNYCLLGATDVDLARFFGVTEPTINTWKKDFNEFALALKGGKDDADANVANRLYKRALGYKHKAVKMFYDPKRGEVIEQEFIEHYPPDPTSAIFWLKNRQPAKWRDKQEVEHRTPDIKNLIIESVSPNKGK